MRTVFVLETRVDFNSDKEWVPFKTFLYYKEATDAMKFFTHQEQYRVVTYVPV